MQNHHCNSASILEKKSSFDVDLKNCYSTRVWIANLPGLQVIVNACNL